MTSARWNWLLVLLACSGLACSEPETYRWTMGKPDGRTFNEQVMPVLLRDCGFPTCHGSPDRFFQVYGSGRTRLDPLTPAFRPTTGPELGASYNMALSMIDLEHPGRSPLLRKPLAVEAGGAGHRGTDRYGRDVYRTSRDQGYLVLARWVFASQPAQMPATMMPPTGGTTSPTGGTMAPPTGGTMAPPPPAMP
jgi:hypothetical protein